MENINDPRIQKAFDWLSLENGEHFLGSEEHCPTRDIFQARLGRMSREMEDFKPLKAAYPLIAAIVGEIGNNSFDHNLGNWRDEKGIYFIYDLAKRFAVVADRGQGVLATLRRVKPGLMTESEAIKTAFTEIISGRAPEQRGNGLKFVEAVVRQHDFTLYFYSGDGMYIIDNGMRPVNDNKPFHGVLAILYF